MRTNRLVAAIGAFALLLSACGGGDDSGAPPDPAVDQQRADRAVAALQARLEADGFTLGDDDDDDGSDFEFQSEECQELEAAFPEEDGEFAGETASAETEGYERGDAAAGRLQFVSGMAGFGEDEDAVQELLELFADDRLGRCLTEAFEQGVQEDAAADDVQVELADLDVERFSTSDLGDGSEGVRITATIRAAIISFPFAIEFEIARAGRSVGGIVIASIGEGATPIDRRALLQLLIDGLTAEE